MKKIFKTLSLLFALGAAFASCAPEEITFSHENPAFEAKEGMILIEAIAPAGIVAGDEIYIIGPAIGDSASVVGVKPEYQLEQSTTVSRKWGVYLNPANFLEGKTLADGFRFVALDKGHEVTPLNEEPNHTLNAVTGKSYNVYMAGAWSNDFLVRPLVELPERVRLSVFRKRIVQLGNRALQAFHLFTVFRLVIDNLVVTHSSPLNLSFQPGCLISRCLSRRQAPQSRPPSRTRQ